MPFGWRILQCQLIISIVSIDFLLIDAIYIINRIDSIHLIDRIDPGFLNYSALKLKDNSNEPTISVMSFWVKKGEIFRVTGIYWHLQIF